MANSYIRMIVFVAWQPPGAEHSAVSSEHTPERFSCQGVLRLLGARLLSQSTSPDADTQRITLDVYSKALITMQI
jgi:hypothetical protein